MVNEVGGDKGTDGGQEEGRLNSTLQVPLGPVTLQCKEHWSHLPVSKKRHLRIYCLNTNVRQDAESHHASEG